MTTPHSSVASSGSYRLRVASVVAALLTACGDCGGCSATSSTGDAAVPRAPVQPRPLLAAITPAAPPCQPDAPSELNAFCSNCHICPGPSTLPRGLWSTVLPVMYEHWATAGKAAPSVGLVEALAYYESHAPEALEYPALPTASDPLHFALSEAHSARGTVAAGVTHVATIETASQTQTFVNDTMHGGMFVLDPRPRTIAALSSPARFNGGDLDRDGLIDLVVADLGAFMGMDTRLGGVAWLRAQPDGSYVNTSLLTDLGRVADVALADVDRDGDLDIAVAVFGTVAAQVVLLRHQSTNAGRPTFSAEVLDSRVGPVDVEFADLDGNGSVELVALIAQEVESVIAYEVASTNATPHVLASAQNPTWGSSGITIGDLDGDADLDIIWAHGDIDILAVQPHHGLHWLENMGAFHFELHDLVFMPGAQISKLGDLDRDGDMDIVTAAALPWKGMIGKDVAIQPRSPSLLWLEQTTRGVFVPHVIEYDLPMHTGLELRDVDGDSDLDLLVTELNWQTLNEGQTQQVASDARWLSVWLNGLVHSDTR